MLESSSFNGGVAERFKAPVLKTGDAQVSVSSNLTPSAILEAAQSRNILILRGFFAPTFLFALVGMSDFRNFRKH
jgi:hypothetical protein